MCSLALAEYSTCAFALAEYSTCALVRVARRLQGDHALGCAQLCLLWRLLPPYRREGSSIVRPRLVRLMPAARVRPRAIAQSRTSSPSTSPSSTCASCWALWSAKATTSSARSGRPPRASTTRASDGGGCRSTTRRTMQGCPTARCPAVSAAPMPLPTSHHPPYVHARACACLHAADGASYPWSRRTDPLVDVYRFATAPYEDGHMQFRRTRDAP